MDRTHLAYISAIVVGAGTVVSVVWWWWSKRQPERPPTMWRKVGEIVDLVCYPIKSFGAVRLNEFECTQLGLRSGWLRDRTLMAIDLQGKFLSGRQYPRLLQISPSMAGSILTLKAPGMTSVSVDLAKLKKCFKAEIWEEKVPTFDCGDEVARWISRFMLQEEKGMRLVYYPCDKPTRKVRARNAPFPLTIDQDTGAFPDVTSYTLENEASILDLNTKIDEPVVAQNFRCNFVVRGAKPYEEDTWDWIMIGNNIFRNVKPCARCIFTTVDPETGVKNPKFEPLKTLRKYRAVTDPKYKKYQTDMPVMGLHMGLRSPNAMVRLGDPVYVSVPDQEHPILVASMNGRSEPNNNLGDDQELASVESKSMC